MIFLRQLDNFSVSIFNPAQRHITQHSHCTPMSGTYFSSFQLTFTRWRLAPFSSIETGNFSRSNQDVSILTTEFNDATWHIIIHILHEVTVYW